MMRVSVTGATGFIGRALCRMLVEHGHAVTAIVRRDDDALARIGRTVCLGEGAGRAAWVAALRGSDAVVHLAGRAHRGEPDNAATRKAFQAVNVDYTRKLLEATVAAGTARFVFLSSAKVFGDRSWEEDGGPHRFRSTSPTAPVGAYGESKLDAERLLRDGCDAHDIRLTILRPPLVYGPGVAGNLRALLGALERRIPLPFASIRNRRSLIHVGQLCAAVVACLCIGDRTPRVMTLADLEISTPGLVAMMGRGLGVQPRLFPFPVTGLRISGRLAGRGAAIARLTDSFVMDGDEIAQILGWRPVIDHAQAWHEIGLAFRRAAV